MAGRTPPLDAQVRTAQADAWQVQGALRERFGGGAAGVAGGRLMSSGLPQPQWNAAFVEDYARFDLAAARTWYASRAFGAGVPWGMLVPRGAPFAHGRTLQAKRCMALPREAFAAAAAPPGVAMVAARDGDIDRVVRLDAQVFGESVAIDHPWIAPHVGACGFTVGIARRAGEAVATAIAIVTNGRAGPSVGIFGVAVLEHVRRRGIGAALTSWLLARAFADGATLAHLNPDSDDAARLYARLGFVETGGFDIRVDDAQSRGRAC